MGEIVELVQGRKQLFVDEFVLQRSENLGRTMHRPQKRGPLVKADRASDGEMIALASAPMWVEEEGVYKMAYEVRRSDQNGKEMALAVSADGLHWEKPDLGLVEFEGSRRNNLFPTPDNCRLWHVVYDPDDKDPARRYKGFVTVRGGRIPAVSPDCLHWTKLAVEPLPSGDAGTLTYDRERREFLGLLKFMGRFGRAYKLSRSRDFVQWSEPQFLFGTDEEDQRQAVDIIRRRLADPLLAKPLFVHPDPALGWQVPSDTHWRHDPVWRAECYNIGLFPYEGLYMGLLMLYYPTGQSLPSGVNCDGFDLIQLAASRDLQNWTRLGQRQPFIGPSRLSEGLVGNYDRMQLQVTNQPVDRGDELWFYYEGMKRRVPQHDRWTDGSARDPSTLTQAERADWLEDTHTAVYVGILRKDGFVSLDGGAEEGYALSRPLVWDGANFFVNLAAANGYARLELLDDQARPLAGFSGADSATVQGDGVRLPVNWGRDLSVLQGQVVHLKIHLKNAALYAFWTE